MILDTNALSAWADGDPAIEPLLRTATRLVIPVVVIGEFEFGIRQSRHASRYAEWLAVNLDTVEVARIDREIAAVYGAIRLELKQAGTPIPTFPQQLPLHNKPCDDRWNTSVCFQTKPASRTSKRRP